MILQTVKISGFRRLNDVSVTIDKKLLALIGANEAGKSSFLQALLSIENSNAYEKNVLTKGVEFDNDDNIIKLVYLLDNTERQLVEKFGGIGAIRHYNYRKVVNGQRYHSLEGNIVRDKALRNNTLFHVDRFLSNKTFKKFIDSNHIEYEIENGSFEKVTLKESLESLKSHLKDEIETYDSDFFEALSEVTSIISDGNKYLTQNVKKAIGKLLTSFEELKAFEELEHPKDRLLKHFSAKRPRFVFFSNDDRYLKGSYTLDELQDPPGSISNLMFLSEVEIDDVLNAIEEEDEGERLRLTDQANENLKAKYLDSWSQNDVFPRLLIDPDSIKIQVISSGNYTEIRSRSDGLKQFIALKAFLAIRREEHQTILLIDEAEIHLHYAAQSDLVRDFEMQNVVNSIIYTTHSAGCLPSDLGTGIRAVEAILNEDGDSGISEVRNSIWLNQGGFSPILFAMGANIIAFTLARKGVIAEGPSETILLPRLIREVTRLDYLDYQVAPGIAEVSQENAALFEFESAKVGYLVDGDIGGNKNKTKLINAGINKKRIVQLDKNYSLEDFVDPNVLAQAINREFDKWNQKEISFPISKIPANNRIKWFEGECKKVNQELPSKVRIAESIVNLSSDEKIVDKKRINALLKIHNRLIKIFD